MMRAGAILVGRRLLSAGRVRSILLLILLGVRSFQYFRLAHLWMFDLHQSAHPRVRHTSPVIIVAIDEESLQRHGQWPWPRTVLARIVGIVAAARPAAIGINILVPEPDRLSPARLPDLVSGLDRDVARRLGSLPSNDAVLAQAIQGRRVVLAVAGLDGQGPGASTTVQHVPVHPVGGDPARFVRQFASALRSTDEIDSAAVGHGLSSVDLERGVVRRLPLLAGVAGGMVPSLGVEMLRLVEGVPALSLRVTGSGIKTVGIGDYVLAPGPTPPHPSTRE